MKKTGSIAIQLLFASLFVWVMAGFCVFEVRHPWATRMEVLIHWTDAMTFKKLSYEEMRPRG